MIDLLFLWVGLVIGFADALRDNFRIAFRVAGVFAICTLHSRRVLEEISAQRATHNIVKLLLDKFVTLFLVYFFFLLSNGSLSVEAKIKRSPGHSLLLEAE